MIFDLEEWKKKWIDDLFSRFFFLYTKLCLYLSQYVDFGQITFTNVIGFIRYTLLEQIIDVACFRIVSERIVTKGPKSNL